MLFRSVRRWDGTGAPLAELSLQSSPLDVRYASADGRHLLTSAIDDPAGPTWRWSLYALRSGVRDAQVTLPTSAARFFLLDGLGGSLVVYEGRPFGRLVDNEWDEVPRRLVAVSRGSSTTCTIPVRDTEYHGPEVGDD